MISKLKSWWFWLILSGLCLWIAWPSSKVVDYMANDPWQRQRWDYLILLMPLYYLFGPRVIRRCPICGEDIYKGRGEWVSSGKSSHGHFDGHRRRKSDRLWLVLILLFGVCVIWFFWLSDSLKSKLFGG
jgi:hypothetical protein